MHIRTLLFGCLLATLALIAPHADAGAYFDAIKTNGKLRIGLTGDYAPFSIYDAKSGNWGGADVELARSLAKALGVEPEFVRTSWPALSADLQAGRFDIAMGGISITKERSEIGFFSSPILSDGKTPIARCADQFRYQTLPAIDRPTTRVIANPGGTNERFARAHLSHAQITLHKDNKSIFDEIIAGRADVMLTDATEARYQARLHPELCAIHPDTPFDHTDKAYLMQKDEALRGSVEAWLSRLRAKGTLKAIYYIN